MRYHDLFDAKAWRKYHGGYRLCELKGLGSRNQDVSNVRVQCGICSTGKQRVFAGYFVIVVLPVGEAIVAEDPYNLRQALRNAEARLNCLGWSLNVIGLDVEWQETGLSANTAYGYHAKFDRAVHMLESR